MYTAFVDVIPHEAGRTKTNAIGQISFVTSNGGLFLLYVFPEILAEIYSQSFGTAPSRCAPFRGDLNGKDALSIRTIVVPQPHEYTRIKELGLLKAAW